MRRSLALFLLAGCAAIPSPRQREVEAAIDSIRVAKPMACRSTTIGVYTMDVYYDLAGITRCVESGHAIEFNPV